MQLHELPKGQTARVSDVHDGPLKAKLLEMGFFNGQLVKVLFTAPFGDPIAVAVGDYLLSLRKEEAANILVEMLVVHEVE